MSQVILKSVSQIYPRRDGTDLTVVSNLNLEIADHEFLVLTGPIGGGQSAVIRMVGGLEAVSKGDIFIGDRRLNDVLSKDRDVALVPGNYVPYPRMTVRENIALGLKHRKFAEGEIKKRVTAAAEVLQLQELLDAKPEVLSAEHRQRLALARAIALQPKVFLFDEPLTDLDPATRALMRNEIAKLHQRLQVTTIYVTHDPIEAMALSGRLVVMTDGTIQQDGSAATLYDEPDNFLVARFLGNPPMNLVQGTLKQDRDFVLFSEMEEGTIEVHLPSSEFPLARDFIGKPVVLGIRPEDIQAAVASNTPAKYGGAFPAIVDLIEWAGREAVMHLKTGANTVVCRYRPGIDRPEFGQRGRFEVDLAKAHLFDAISTRRIGPGT
ncbi:MAG TPA: ABC transporter ATP-binding protein [Chthoniobacterales bacterium]|nr:ABC transporter ATP-binding protein [Chthoniobacterales bacterium]